MFRYESLLRRSAITDLSAFSSLISKVGWPSQGNDTASSTYEGAVANTKNMQYFLDNYACQSTANGTLSFWFEMYDEEWKDIAFGGVEGYWGLFDKNKRLKDITFPTC